MRAKIEREVKLEFDAPPPQIHLGEVVAANGQVAEELAERHLDAQYYDTEDLRLTRWGCSLRHRSDEGWMVKLPGPIDDEPGVLQRSEVHIDGDQSSPPREAIGLVAPFSRGETLQPIARLRTTRRPLRVSAAHGQPLAEVVEDDVRVDLGGQSTWHFQMVEIELADGGTMTDVSALVRCLREAGAQVTSRSKLARALGRPAQAPPDVVIPAIGDSPTGREVIRAALTRSVRSHLLYLPYVRVGEGTEAVHQARVALRRLRSDLRTFGPLLQPSWVSEISAGARWLGDCLGEVRDADVRVEILGQLVDDDPSIAREQAAALLERMRIQRDRAHVRLLEALDSPRCHTTHDLLVDAARDPMTAPQADDPAETTLPSLVARPWTKLKKTVKRIGPEATEADYHRIRIKAKRCRYAAEAVHPVLGKPARRLARQMKRIQNSLGDLNDATTIRAHLAATAPQHDELSFVAGEFSGLLSARARHCAADFERLWSETRHIELPDRGSE